MTHPKPTIPEAYAKHRAAFIKRVPFCVLLKDDMAYLLKATARDAGVTVKEVRDAMLQHWLAKAREMSRTMTPAQKTAMFAAQAASLARAEAGFGSDADEAEYRRAQRTGDTQTLRRLDTEAAARVARIDAVMGAIHG